MKPLFCAAAQYRACVRPYAWAELLCRRTVAGRQRHSFRRRQQCSKASRRSVPCALNRVAARRFHLAEWDGSIMRKLDTLEIIYGKLSDQVTSRRMEMRS